MSNAFTGTNIEVFESHLIYWIKSVTSLDGFYVGKKTPSLDEYFTIEFINISNKGTPWKEINSGATTSTIKNHKTLSARITIYGDSCTSNILKTTNSIHGEWINYLRDTAYLGYGKTGQIKISNDFNFTDFLPQAQVDIQFNILVYTTETIFPIESVETDLDIDTDYDLDTNEFTLNINVDYEDIT